MPNRFVIALTLVLCSLLWSAPVVALAAQDASTTPPPSVTPTLTPSPTATITLTPTPAFTPTLTPLPPEYIETPDQTTGILFGAVFLVIIIVGGTFFILRRKR
jgi:hypothetical protein